MRRSVWKMREKTALEWAATQCHIEKLYFSGVHRQLLLVGLEVSGYEEEGTINIKHFLMLSLILK